MGESDLIRIPELVLTNIAMEAMALIEIDDLPNLNMGGFSMANC